MHQTHHSTRPRPPPAQVAPPVEPPTAQQEARTWTWGTVVIAGWLVVAGVAGARLTPLTITVAAGGRSGDTCATAPARTYGHVASTAGHASRDGVLPVRYRKATSKRLRERLGVLSSSMLLNGTVLVAAIPTISQGAPPEGAAPYRTPARAPPAAYQPA